MLPYMIKRTLQTLRILRWRNYPGLSQWAQWHHKEPYKREPRGSEAVVGEMMSEVRKGPGVQEGRKPEEAEKREKHSLLEPRGESGPDGTLPLAQWDLGPQNHTIIHLCCFKPLLLAATENKYSKKKKRILRKNGQARRIRSSWGKQGEEVHLSLQQQRWESTQMINQRSLFIVQFTKGR